MILVSLKGFTFAPNLEEQNLAGAQVRRHRDGPRAGIPTNICAGIAAQYKIIIYKNIKVRPIWQAI